MMNVVSIHPDLQFSYLDSGKPDSFEEYDTIFIFHGHTFHSGTFGRLLKPSRTRNLRVIAINRRGYPGSTPFSEEEAAYVNSSSEELVEEFLEKQGNSLALVVDLLAIELGLPVGHNLTLCAWSLGNCFLVNLLANIGSLETGVRDRLHARMKGVILWDPPLFAFGFRCPAGGYIPLYDESIEPEGHLAAFVVWVSSYWKHGDLSARDYGQLEQCQFPKYPVPSPTADRMTTEELAAMISSSPESQLLDNMLLISPIFTAAQERQFKKGLLDPAVREMWGNLQICHLMGDANCWPVIYGHWRVEEMTTNEENRKAGFSIGFKILEGGNHFVMWEHPEIALDALQACIAGDMSPVPIVNI